MAKVDVRVNGEELDLEFGAGESLGEVLSKADLLLERAGSVIVGLWVDGRPVDAEGYSEVRDLPSAEVGSVEIKAESAGEYRAKAVTVFLDLLGLASKVAAGEEASWAGLKEGGDELVSNLSALFSAEELAYVTDFVAFLDRAAPEIEEAGGSPSEARRNELAERTGALETIFRERLAELLSPVEEMRKIAGLFAREAEELRELPVYLQTGKEERAMKAVLVFIETFNKVIRLMPELKRAGVDTESIRVEGLELPAFYAAFNEVLRQLSQALEDKDSVLIGDLAEYEVAPRMSGLFSALEEALASS